MLIQIDDATAATYGIHGHQHSYFNTFLQLYDIRNKDVLEVGGAMPGGLVLDHLGANSWTAVQSAEYALHRDDNQVPTQSSFEGRYYPIFRNIEDLADDADFHHRYDVIFSIACFEHIHKLPQALKAMRRALKPGGRLFTMFAPIWSGPWGQHYTDKVPDRFKAIEPPGGWANQHIFGPWDHLLLSRVQFYQHCAERFDPDYAEELTYITYNSPQINRFFFEDYEAVLSASGMRKLLLNGLFRFPETDMSLKITAVLRQRYAYAGYNNFSDAGIVAFLEN